MNISHFRLILFNLKIFDEIGLVATFQILVNFGKSQKDFKTYLY